MKLSAQSSVVAVVALLLFSGFASTNAAPSSIVHAVANAGSPVHATLSGTVREGQFRGPGTSKPIRYIYLELNEPIGKYVNNLKASEKGYREVELVGGSSADIRRLEALVGKKATVRGKLPFTFDANAPKVVLPLVMLMDTSNPQLFK